MRIPVDSLKNCGLLKPCYQNVKNEKALCVLLTDIGQLIARDLGETDRSVQIGVSNGQTVDVLFVENEKILNRLLRIIFIDGMSKTTFVGRSKDIATMIHLISEGEKEIPHIVWHLYNGMFALTLNDDDALVIKLTV